MSGSTEAEWVPAVESVLEGFVAFLRSERALSERSIETYLPKVREFLAQVGSRDLRELTAADVSNAVLSQVIEGRAPASVRVFATALRSFLRYCHVVGVLDRELSAAALPVATRRRSLLPQGITPAESAALLSACDTRGTRGRRDYAVIVLILRLGLRATEVATVQLDDIDWRTGTITVHGKGARVDELPLPTEVGKAIAAYLRNGRPAAPTRELFLGERSRSGLGRDGVSRIVAAASKRAGIGVVRAHRLRHTAASEMLAHGAGLAEIGQVLRHRSEESTAIYARVDVARLRTIARPWPRELEW